MGAVPSPCARVERPAVPEQGEDLQTFDRALLAQAMGKFGNARIPQELSTLAPRV